MQELKGLTIINKITASGFGSGDERLWSELSEKECKEVAVLIQERVMSIAGYKKRTS